MQIEPTSSLQNKAAEDQRIPLSVTLITFNCVGSLRATLESLTDFAEIIVVDSGSDDGTRELAQSFGAKVIVEPWRGFGAQKQFAVEQAKFDWVLCIDSDEIVSPQLRNSIALVMQKPGHPAYQFPRRNRFLGRYLKHGEGYPDLCLRLFDRRRARWSDDQVHEKVITLGNVGLLEGDLLHHSEDTLEAYLIKQNRYTTLAARDLINEGVRVSASQVVLSPVFRFVKFYFFRLGFLDGLPGLIHILIGCFNSFCKYAKMLEFSRRT